MAKGYAEGPAAEEAERRREELAAGVVTDRAAAKRLAVYGATADDPARHFLGWVGDVDPDELFSRAPPGGSRSCLGPLPSNGRCGPSSPRDQALAPFRPRLRCGREADAFRVLRGRYPRGADSGLAHGYSVNIR